MCLACQMEDELWVAYLEHVAAQQKAAADAAAAPGAPEPDKPAAKSVAAAPVSPFACEELPPE